MKSDAPEGWASAPYAVPVISILRSKQHQLIKERPITSISESTVLKISLYKTFLKYIDTLSVILIYYSDETPPQK